MTSRHRERMISHKQAEAHYTRFNSSGSLLYSDSNISDVDLVNETMDDVVVQNFRARQAEGDVIINPLVYVKESFKTVGLGHLQWTRTNGYVYKYDGPGVNALIIYLKNGVGGFLTPTPTPPTDVGIDASRLQALGSLDRAPYSFAEDIAEMRETLRFLKDPFASLKNLSEKFQKGVTQNLRSRNVKAYTARDRAKAIADVWLQYRFAFSPLVRSLSDLIESFNDSIHLPSRRTARGSYSWEKSDSNISDPLDGHVWESSGKTELLVRSGILYEDANPLVGWRDKYGLRFKDIPETLWAIVPYSFMVDRVWNLSESLRGFVSFLDPNIKILGAWTSIRTTTTQTRSHVDFDSSVVQSVDTTSYETDVKEIFTLTRDPWTPSITDLIPPVEVRGLVDTSTKLADIAALVLQRLR